jgi:hypothetical protein
LFVLVAALFDAWKQRRHKVKRILTLIVILQIGALSSTALADAANCKKHYSNDDYDAAFQPCLEAAQKGDSDAQQKTAFMYLAGLGTIADAAQALHYYKLAAENGVTRAQHEVAAMYSSGNGIPQNYKKAIEWYEKAANNGNPPSQLTLGHIYADGTKTDRDFNKALHWYKKASESGLYYTLVNMAKVFNEGLVVPRNAILSHAYYNLAAATIYSNDEQRKRRELEEEMTFDEISIAQQIASECLEQEYNDCFSETEVSKR